MKPQISRHIDDLEKLSIEIRKELLKIRSTNSVRVNSLKSYSETLDTIIHEININQATAYL